MPQTVVVPAHPVISDDEGSKEQDKDVADPTFIPPCHNLDNPGPSKKGPSVKRCVQPTMEALEDNDDDNDKHNINDKDEDEDQPATQAKRPIKKRKPTGRLTIWKKVT